jgi:hypothetical protein
MMHGWEREAEEISTGWRLGAGACAADSLAVLRVAGEGRSMQGACDGGGV